jgi:hypothetical protein
MVHRYTNKVDLERRQLLMGRIQSASCRVSTPHWTVPDTTLISREQWKWDNRHDKSNGGTEDEDHHLFRHPKCMNRSREVFGTGAREATAGTGL